MKDTLSRIGAAIVGLGVAWFAHYISEPVLYLVAALAFVMAIVPFRQRRHDIPATILQEEERAKRSLM